MVVMPLYILIQSKSDFKGNLGIIGEVIRLETKDLNLYFWKAVIKLNYPLSVSLSLSPQSVKIGKETLF